MRAASSRGENGFDDVVVGAELEARDAVGLLVARGQHHDRHLRVRAHLPAHLEAVDPGQADVEHDEPHRMAPQLGDGLLAGAEPDDAPAVLLLEIGLDETADRSSSSTRRRTPPVAARAMCSLI